MSDYRIEFTASAAKELRKVDAGIRRRIMAGVDDLKTNPRPAGCKKLVSESNAWRIRVGDYRVLYEVFDDLLLVSVVRLAHRRDVYR